MTHTFNNNLKISTMPQEYGKTMTGTDAKMSGTTTPHFKLQMDRFSECNDLQVELLSQIESKLHFILNKRNQEKNPGSEKRIDSDFVQAFDSQLNRLSNQNDILQKLLDHLSEMI